MGIPYRHRGINVISIAIDAPQDAISALTGKLGRLEGVTAKTAYSNCIYPEEAWFYILQNKELPQNATSTAVPCSV